MPKRYRTLAAISVWVLFFTFILSILLPVIVGLVTGALIGGINSVEDGELWFHRHGLSFLIGIAAFFGYYYATKLLKELSTSPGE